MKFDLCPEIYDTLITETERATFSQPMTASTLADSRKSDSCRIYAVTEDGELMGYCVLYTFAPDSEITSLVVRPQFRGYGVGTFMLKKLASALKKEGFEAIFLDVRPSNTNAIGLYEKCGFYKIAERKNFYELPREDSYTMRKEL